MLNWLIRRTPPQPNKADARIAAQTRMNDMIIAILGQQLERMGFKPREVPVNDYTACGAARGYLLGLSVALVAEFSEFCEDTEFSKSSVYSAFYFVYGKSSLPDLILRSAAEHRANDISVVAGALDGQHDALIVARGGQPVSDATGFFEIYGKALSE